VDDGGLGYARQQAEEEAFDLHVLHVLDGDKAEQEGADQDQR
jgi:tRNA A-37 threonylcarbamoyl transferase component Bud32